MLPYLVTIIVLVAVSMRKKRESEPPAALDLHISEKNDRFKAPRCLPWSFVIMRCLRQRGVYLCRKEVKNMLSENLKTLRRQKGFTQEELAARLNVVRQTVSKWEKGVSRG